MTAVAGTAATAGAAENAAPAERPFQARHAASSGRRPNILVILGDDLGWADLSSYGAPHIRTPHLDRLARQGVRFTEAYSGSATCSATRFSLYTGRYPGRTPGGLAEPIGNRTQGLDPNHPTLASLLKKAGYATALIGKWHCGWLPDYSPTKSGWDEFFGNHGGVLEYFSKLGQLGDYDLYEGDATYKDLRYYTEVLTERAVEYVGRDHDRPWLLNLNFTTPHWPWLAEGDEETGGAEIEAKIRAAKTQAEVVAALNHFDGGSVLGVQMGEMGLHGRLADEQFTGDLTVGRAPGDQGQHLALARGERLVAGGAHGRDQTGGDGRGEDRTAVRRRPDGREQLVARGVLEQIARRARLDRGQGVRVRVVRGEDEDFRAGGPAGQFPDGVDSPAARHAQIHQDHVGVERGGPRQCLDTVRRLAEDGESGGVLEHAAQTVPYDGMVVDDQQRDVTGHGGPTVREPTVPCRGPARTPP